MLTIFYAVIATSRLSVAKPATNSGGPLVPISTPRRRSSINPAPAPHELKAKRSSIQLAPRATPQQSSSTRISSIATRIPPTTSRMTRRPSELALDAQATGNTSISGIPARQRKISSIPAASSIRVGTTRRVSTSAAQTADKVGRVGGEGRKLAHAKSEANIRIGRPIKQSPTPPLPSSFHHLSPLPPDELSPPIQSSNLAASINSTRSWETLPIESTRASLSLAQRFRTDDTGDSSEEVGNATMLEYDRSWETDEASRRASLLPPSSRPSLAGRNDASYDATDDVSTPIQSSASPLGTSQRARLRNPAFVDPSHPLTTSPHPSPLNQTPITKSLRQTNLNSASPLDAQSMYLQLMKGSTASDDILKMSLRSARNVSKDWFSGEGALHGLDTPTDRIGAAGDKENELLGSLMRDLECAERRVFELEELNREKGEEMEELVVATRREAERREIAMAAKEQELEKRRQEMEVLSRQAETRRLRTTSHETTQRTTQVSAQLHSALSVAKESYNLSTVFNNFLAASAKSERAVIKSQLEALVVLRGSLELWE